VDAIHETRLPHRRGRIRRESKKLSFRLYAGFYEPIVFVQATWRQLIILGAMFVSGAEIFSYYGALPPVNAFLASVSTITTIGLYVPNGGNFTTLNHTESALLIVMIIVSVGAGTSVVQATVGAFVSGDLALGKAEEHVTSRLKGHVVVYGFGYLGKYVVDKLAELGMDYVVVTTEQALFETLRKGRALVVLEHETRPMDALKAAGIEKAGILIASHEDDSRNMMITLSARKLRPDLRIISAVHDSELVDAAKSAGADVVIPSAVTVGHLLALSAVTKDLVGVVFEEEIGTKEIARFSVFKSSKLIGKDMQEASKLAVVIGVIRDSQVFRDIFVPGFRLQEGDTILVLGDPGNLETLEREAGAK